MPGGRPVERAEVLLLAGLSALVVALSITPITNNDLFLHLRTGRLILEGGSIPSVDDYSALARGRPFVAHEWLAGVLFRAIQGPLGARGFDALILLKTLVALLVALLLYLAARRLGAAQAIAVLGLAPVMILAAARLLVRPHIFSYLLTACFLWLLARRRATRRAPPWVFVLLQILWANLHGSFLLGPAIVCLAGGSAILDGLLRRIPAAPAGARADGTAPEGPREGGRLLALGGLLLAACLVNPYGAHLLRFPFELTGSAFMGEIYEWQPPFGSAFSSTHMARLYVAWIALGGATFLTAGARAVRRRGPMAGGSFPLLLFCLLLALSLRMNRSVTDFALATLPGIAANATSILPGPASTWARSSRSVRWLLPLLLGLSLWYGVRGYAFSPTTRRGFGLGLGANIPVAAADYLEARGIRGNVLNTYAAGAYLIYRFHPDIRVAMDSRNAVYGEALYARYRAALSDPARMDALLRELDAAAIFLEWSRPGMRVVAETVHRVGGWTPVYFDDGAVVYLRRGGVWTDVVRRDGYRALDPALFLPGNLTLATAPGALVEADRAIARARACYVARVMRIDALAALGRRQEARREEKRILRERPRLHHIYTYLGLLHLRLGEREEAVARFREALSLFPGSAAALRGLEEAAGSR